MKITNTPSAIYCVGIALCASNGSPLSFELMYSNDNDLPWLIHDPKGLTTASRYTGIYRISHDFQTAHLVVNEGALFSDVLPIEVSLAEKQQDNIKTAIQAGCWFN